MNYGKIAASILELVGGEKNVDHVTHCATRLRFNLKNDGNADTEAIKKVKGVMGVSNSGGQYQVIIGNDVNNVYKEIIKLGNFKTGSSTNSVKKGKVATILDTLSGVFTPILPAMIGCAMIKAVLVILKSANMIQPDSQIYSILTFISDSAYYFLPMLLAWSSAVKFKCNVGLAIALAGVLLHPNFSALMADGNSVKFLGLPITKATYTSSVIPIIMAVWVMSYVEKFAEKYSPSVVKSILKPLIIMLIMAPITLIVIGPLGTIIGNYLAIAVSSINTYAGWLVSGIMGATFPFLIMTGMHYSLGPIAITAYTTTGVEGIVGPGMLVHSFTQSAAALAVALKTKNKDLKQVATSTSMTAILGVTEPAMFGVNLRLKKPLLAVVLGGLAGGIYVGAFGVARSAMGVTGLATLPAFITENPHNLLHAVIGCVIGFVVTFILTFILGFEDIEDEESTENTDSIEVKSLNKEGVITSPLKGEVVELSTIKDETFASGIMGKGVAIIPSEGKLTSPVNGVISAIFPTLHAVGITSEDGIELLIHIGMDTVQLEGKYFKSSVKAGDNVKAGDLLISFDINKIKEAGYEIATPIVVTNSNDYTDVLVSDKKQISFGERLMTII
ncbi:PTS glucose transporter subunit IIA [Clostridium sp. Sa3CUN1]|uniref:PTS glucose transporter subunit IIA n=1 Tax=Clostridium gallinarum TaxID=2762246 RepID=A0ABR8Q4R3_9CLOT|nr:beta-glucoside-specific PTS transporter subunit IIABC [Clostridium gallinarum]MBD7915400.1 PTS glucose transporter subunit IIA [Clostridium gallinarum]